MAEEPLRDRAPQRSGPQDIGLPEIPGYRIEETLGRGSTGVVYRATQLAVDRQVALKVLHPDLTGRPRAVRRLQREARTAAKLAHPNIVSAIDMGQVGALWWYAMELVEGESLAERLKRVGRISEREALRLFTPLVDALDHAFRQGVVHRDIKPANILIDTAGRARLVDLGLAFREDDPLITSPGSTLGTPHYVSPEQARNPEAADTRSDIWSLGATLYHAVCGRPPFAGESVAEILSGVLYGRVAEPREFEPALSRGLALVLRKCLSRDPARRYPCPRELLDDLERLREKRPVLVQPADLDPVRARGAWRARLPWLGAAAALVLVAAAWFARDVLAPERPPSEEPELSEGWSELEALAQAALMPDAQPAPALVELAALNPVPSRHRARYQQVEEELVRRLREAQAAFGKRLTAELDRLLNQRDFVAALSLVSPEGFAARAREELLVDAEQLVAMEQAVRPQELRQRVVAELDAYAGELSERVEEHFAKVVFARAENDRREGLWRQAREQLTRQPLELLAEADLVVAGLPRERVDVLETALRAELTERRGALDEAWRRLDAELAGWLEDEAARLAARLRARSQARPAADELAELYARRCGELRIVAGERLPEISEQAARALERLGGELVMLERSLLDEDARVWLADALERADRLRRERRFEELVELWRWALERDWLAPVHVEAELELRAAQLLQGLLERAAQRVLELDGQTLAILVGSIEMKGRLAAGSSPLELGFALETSDVGTVGLTLRPLTDPGGARPHLLPPEAIERFAGLPADPAATADPADRVARALLRFHEGDAAGALACLPVPHTGDPLLDSLAGRLEVEVSRRDVELKQDLERRVKEAAVRLNVVLRIAGEARLPGDREAAVRTIDELLATYGGLEPIRARESELRQLRSRLAPGRPPSLEDYREVFAPTAVELENGRVSLSFDFGTLREGAWSRGDWRVDANGWIARAPHSLEEILGEEDWPRIALGPPLDLDGPLEAVLTFEQPQDSPARLLVVSVAGVHVALRGEQGGESARARIASGGPQELRQLVFEIDAKGQGRAFAGLARGERYQLSVELSRKRSKASVRLWGRDPRGEDFGGRLVVEQLVAPSPEGQSGAAYLMLRSIEPLRLLEATLRAPAVTVY